MIGRSRARRTQGARTTLVAPIDAPVLASLVFVLALAALLLSGCGRQQPPPAKPKPRLNVLLVTIDTFRADRLGAGVAPALDRLASSGIRFTAARTTVPLTLPSHATIMTGLLPPAHGVRENGLEPLDDRHATIARLLKGKGYQTGAFVGAFVLDRRFGLAQGFDTYDDHIARDPNASERLDAERKASEVVDRALAWLDQRPGHAAPGTVPFFLWVHLYDPHAPYTPPAEFRAADRSPYNGEIAYADSQIARVFNWLRTHALADRTIVVFVGDHGEALGEHHERTHGMLLYDATLRVPLVIVAPGRPPATRDDAVSLTDVAPTILGAAGLTVPAEMKGRNLLDKAPPPTSAIPAAGAQRQPELYSETEYPRTAGWSALQALTDGRWMAIRSSAGVEIYDLQTDRAQARNVAASQPALAAAMTARIDAIRAGATAAPGKTRTVAPEVAERLQSLGYVASAGPSSATTTPPNPAGHIEAWNTFEDALSDLNNHRPGALPALQRLAHANPDSMVFQSTYLRALKDAGQVGAALALYRTAARRWPTDSMLQHELAVAAREAAGRASGPAARALLVEAGRSEEAALAIAPANAAARNGLGLIAVDDDRPANAASEFERAVALDPNNAPYWTNLGNARRAGRDEAGAEQAYRRALAVDSRSADAANGLGVLLVESKHAADAMPWFERALAVSPGLVEARLNLGIALQQAGQTPRAIETYLAVLGTPGSHPREKQAAAKLLASIVKK
jgi:choline-sulfatase